MNGGGGGGGDGISSTLEPVPPPQPALAAGLAARVDGVMILDVTISFYKI